MKRSAFAWLVMGLLAACAGITAPGAARTETPQQSLATTGKQMQQLRSVKFDLAGTATLTLPQQLVDQLRARASSQAAFLNTATTVAFQVSGAAARPDKLQATITARIGGVTLTTEVRAAGNNLYYKDPMTATWRVVDRASFKGHQADHPRLSYQTVLDTATSITEVGDTATLNGVQVEHYRVVPNLVKLFAQVATQLETRDPQAASAIEEALRGVNLTFDVWTGVNDNLIRRLSYDADATVDLHQLAALNPRPAEQGLNLPPGSIAHLTAHAVLNLHDFNAPVSVVAPALGS